MSSQRLSDAFLAKTGDYTVTVTRPDLEMTIVVKAGSLRACRNSNEMTDDAACVEFSTYTQSHMLPSIYKVFTFNDTSDDMHLPMVQTIQTILHSGLSLADTAVKNSTAREMGQIKLGAVDTLLQYAPNDIIFIDFWYKTLCEGPLTRVGEPARTLDGLGFIPAQILTHDDSGFEGEEQLALNVDRAYQYYTQLQGFHRLPIGPAHEAAYVHRREHAVRHLRPIDGVSALMQLLCTWSKETDPAQLQMAWVRIFDLWNHVYHTGVDEALLRFKALLLDSASEQPEQVAALLQATSISQFVQNLCQSSLRNRQNIAHALTDIFQNQAIGQLMGRTASTNIEHDQIARPHTPPMHVLSEKILLVHKGQIKAPFVTETGEVHFAVVNERR